MNSFIKILFLFFALTFINAHKTNAQNFPFSSGFIPMCDTSYFTATVSGAGILEPPGFGWGSSLTSLLINISSNHPHTLVVTLISPAGTSLLLTAYNGAGGSNYTNTNFVYSGSPSITIGTAPFTGNFLAQGGSFSIFNGENPNGTWTISVIDTACGSPPPPPGGGPGVIWNNGYFNGSGGGGNGGISVGSNTPPCQYSIPDGLYYLCDGDVFNVAAYYTNYDPSLSYSYYDYWFNPVAPPTAVNISSVFIVIGTDWFGCQYNAYFEIIVEPQIILGPDQTVSICSGGVIDLHSLFNLNGVNAYWSFNGTSISSAAASSVGTAGVYLLIGQNNAGCNDTALVTVMVNNTINLGPDQIINLCPFTTIDLTQLYSTSGLTTSWTVSGIPVNDPTSIDAGGNYMLIAYDINGCVDTVEVTVININGLSLGADQFLAICNGDNINLNSVYNTTNLITNWTYNGTTVSNPGVVTNPGAYTLIATDVNGCSDTAVVDISIAPSPLLGSNQFADVCSNSTLDLNSFYNLSGLIPLWTNNGTAVINPGAVSAGGIYTLVAINGSGCRDTAEVVVNSIPAPDLGIDQYISVCVGDTINLSSYFNTNGLTTAWATSGVPVANTAQITASGMYTVIASAANGCSDTANISVVFNATPVLGNNQQIDICNGTAFDLTALYNTNGLTGFWTNGNNPVNNPDSIVTSGIYTLTATNASGCTSTVMVGVVVHQKPDLGEDYNLAICSNKFINLTTLYNINGLTSYWTLNGNQVNNANYITNAGNYQLIAVNGNGCSDTAMVFVDVYVAPVLGQDFTFDLCPWMAVNLNELYATSGLNATWMLNGQVMTNVNAIHNSGTYRLIVTDTNGCTDSALVFINAVFCSCDADFSVEAKCMEDPVQFTLLADSIVLGAHWTFGDGLIPDDYTINPSIMLGNTDSILITMEAYLTCDTINVQKYIKVDNCADSCHFYFPSAFTPNNDGINDRFYTVGDCTPEQYNIEIYNRYGQMVFRSNNPHSQWDGKYQNILSPTGVYLIYLKYQLPYQMPETTTGKLVLMN